MAVALGRHHLGGDGCVTEGKTISTTSADYSGSYYNAGHLGGYDDYNWESDEWRGFFLSVADRIVGLVEPETCLDVGCAKGLLVQALASRGVDAHGIDLSEHAVETAHADVAGRLKVQSATQPIGRRYDLITCVEVLEHMSNAEAQQAIDNICAATDLVLFSSSPGDFHEATHINTHPTPQWAAWFAERGFYRRTDADVSFIATWAVLFERADISKRSIVERYETMLEPMNRELIEKRQALLDMRRRVTDLEPAQRAISIADRDLLARHAGDLVVAEVAALEAKVARLKERLAHARERSARLQDRLAATAGELKAVRESRTWKAGRVLVGPMTKLRISRSSRS